MELSRYFIFVTFGLLLLMVFIDGFPGGREVQHQKDNRANKSLLKLLRRDDSDEYYYYSDDYESSYGDLGQQLFINDNWITDLAELIQFLEDLQGVDEGHNHEEPVQVPVTVPTKKLTTTARRPPTTTPKPKPSLPKDALTMLKKHNDLRRLAGASNMYELTWSKELARMAEVWAKRCVFEHGQPRGNHGYTSLGQNLYMGGGEFNINSAIQMWYDEIESYNFGSNSCWGVCGHYTQVVWAKTKELGCAAHYCPGLMGMGATLYVCNYGPPGNYVGQWPYKSGTACSQCDSGDKCNNGLCQAQ